MLHIAFVPSANSKGKQVHVTVFYQKRDLVLNYFFSAFSQPYYAHLQMEMSFCLLLWGLEYLVWIWPNIS